MRGEGDRPGRAPSGPRGWHGRGYLPHFDAGEAPQSITFRLAGSLPSALLRLWRDELQTKPTKIAAAAEERRRIEEYLNRGSGPTWLANPDIASIAEDALQFFNGTRYRLHAWVVMPNHVHVVMTPSADASVAQIVASWKSYTAHRANSLLDRHGAFWQEDYFDRLIRNERHFHAAVAYVESNPVVAGLCATPEAWPFSSARHHTVP